MATKFVPLDDAEKALRTAYAAGDKDAMRVAARDIINGRARLERSRANIAKDQEGYGPGGTAWEGFGGTLPNIGRRAARIVLPKSMEKGKALETLGLVDEGGDLDSIIRNRAETDAAGSTASKVGRFIGDAAVTAPIGGAAGAGVRAFLPAAARLSGSTAGGAIGRGLSYGAEGAAASALLDDSAEGAIGGAGLNMALTPGINRVGRLVRTLGGGMRRTPEAQTLLDHGGDLSLGQHDPKGWLGSIEQTAEVSPILGRSLRNVRQNATHDVVPNLEADLLGRKRVPGESLERNAQRRAGTMNALYRGVDKVGLDPSEIAAQQAGRQKLASEARTAEFGAREIGEKRVNKSFTAMDLAEEQAKAAEKIAARKGATAVQKAKAKDLRAAYEQIESKAGFQDITSPLSEGRKAARDVIENNVPDTLKDLRSAMRSSMKRNPLGDASRVEKEIMAAGRASMKANDVGGLRRAHTQLKQLEASYRYGRGRAADTAAADVIRDARSAIEARVIKSLGSKPQLLANMKRADNAYGQTAPIESAKNKALKRGDTQVRGRDLLGSLAEGMTEGEFNRGLAGGVKQKVAKALTDLESHNTTSAAIERQPLLRQALNTALVPGVALLNAKPFRRLAQGQLPHQRFLRQTLGGQRGENLADILKGARRGSISAGQAMLQPYDEELE